MNILSFIPKGEISLPSSKSIFHRSLIASFIANKKSTISYKCLCEDVFFTLKALENLGGEFKVEENQITFLKRHQTNENVEIYVKDSASTLRFIFLIGSYLCPHLKIKGSKTLFNRGIEPYINILKKQNIKYILKDDSIEIFSSIKVEDFILTSNLSSQFISGYLFLLGLSNQDQYIEYPSNMQSNNYVDLTIDILSKVGIEFYKNNNSYRLKKINYQPLNIILEQDYSSLSNFAVLGSLKGNVTFHDLNLTSLQGDKRIMEILMDGRSKIDFFQNKVTFYASLIKGQEIDISDCIDLGPILFVLGAFSYGETRLINTARLKYKESNRVLAMAEELKKAGVDIVIYDNEVVIKGKATYKGNYHFDSHNDHRICMALAIFAVLNDGNCIIDNDECVNKSYPTFFQDLFSLRSSK